MLWITARMTHLIKSHTQIILLKKQHLRHTAVGQSCVHGPCKRSLQGDCKGLINLTHNSEHVLDWLPCCLHSCRWSKPPDVAYSHAARESQTSYCTAIFIRSNMRCASHMRVWTLWCGTHLVVSLQGSFQLLNNEVKVQEGVVKGWVGEQCCKEFSLVLVSALVQQQKKRT